MITILHGDNIVASRNQLHELRDAAREKEIITFSSSPTLTETIQALESSSLFGGERLVIFENILTKLGRKTKDEVADYLRKGNFATDCIVWESKILTPAALSQFPKETKAEQFKQSKSLFKLLDAIGILPPQNVLHLYHQCLAEEAAELIFAMIIRQCRILLAIQTDAAIEEVKRMQPWQLGKLERQARVFSEERLISVHDKLYNLDYAVKTGQSPLPLAAQLDIILAEV